MACGDVPPKAEKRPAPVFKLETKVIDQNEKFHLVEFPDGRTVDRCITYVNVELKQSHMQCDFMATPAR